MDKNNEFEKFIKKNIYTAKYQNNYNPKNNNNVVVSSRIRLARNLENFPFPENCTDEQLHNIFQTLIVVTKYDNDKEKNVFKKLFSNAFLLENLHEENCVQLRKNHLITDRLQKERVGTAVFINKDKNLSLMVNEEDHFRLQYLLPGLQFKKIWNKINKLDDYLSSMIPFSFDKQFGYTTASLANVGTGLRCSAMVHLPGLFFTDKLQCVIKAANQLSMTIRGFYGEGSENLGHMFQVLNYGSLGESEEQIINRCQKFIDDLIEYELNARNELLTEEKVKITDKVARAYGLLQNCYSLTEKECLEMLSLLRFGCAVGMFKNIDVIDVDHFFTAIMCLKSADNSKIMDVSRAELITSLLEKSLSKK